MSYHIKRLARVREKLVAQKINSFLITNIHDISWLTGFTGSTAYLLITKESALFSTDGRYQEQSAEEVSTGYDIKIVTSYRSFFQELCSKFDNLTLQQSANISMMLLLQGFGAIVNFEENETVLTLRMVKDKRDIESIRKEYERGAKSFLLSLDSWHYGQKEIEWAAKLEYNMKMLGAKGSSFDTIVASGVRGALPHGVASEKVIHTSEPVTIDFGTQGGYACDYTRVVYNGKDKKVLDVIDIVTTALEKAKDAVKPGVKCRDIDKIARDYIESKGYGKYFNHSLGHGVGKEVHEQPSINMISDNTIESGMVFTIEPGIYLPGEFGIRLEETVIVNDLSCELLSSMLDKYVYEID